MGCGGLVTVPRALKWATTEGMKRREFYEALETLIEMEIINIVEDKTGKRSLSYAFKSRR